MHLRNEIAEAATVQPRAGFHGGLFHSSAVIDPSAVVFSGAWIGPNVTIGADCVIGPGASIGAPGFGYEKVKAPCAYPLDDGRRCLECKWCQPLEHEYAFQYRTHTAGVVIERDVHIGANACVDQGRHRPTVIREGARIDNLVHVGHNVEIGRNALVVALSMLGGTSEVGEGGYVASATVRDHVTIGAGARAGLGCVVTKDVPAGETWAGVPAKRFGHAGPATVTHSVPQSLQTTCGCIYEAHCSPTKKTGCKLARGGTVNDGGGVCPPKGER